MTDAPESEGYPLPDHEWDEWETDHDLDPHEWPPAGRCWPTIEDWWDGV